MTAEKAPVVPTLAMTLSDAVEEMTGFEVLGIERHYARKMEELGGLALTIGVVWVYQNRAGKVGWPSVEGMTLRALNGYFAQPEDGTFPEDPDSDLGKDG